MAGLEAGVAKHEITPPVGFPLSGYGDRKQGSIGIHDPLFAKVLVLKSGDVTIGIVSCDIITIPDRSVEEARNLIGKYTNTVGSNIMIHGTHTHTGPGPQWDHEGDMGEEWRTILGRKIAGAFLEAWRGLRTAKIGLADGECFIGVNRRNPSSPIEPHLLYSWPDGPFEPLVKVLRVDAIKGGTICTIVNYGCHGVTLGPHELMISRDFSGYAVDLIERAKPGSICMFLNAPCGNVNPRWCWEIPQPKDAVPRFNWAGSRPRWGELSADDRFREAERLGNILGGESLRVLEQIIDFHDKAEIASKMKKISLPVKSGPERKFELQAFKIGDIAVLGLPEEVFLELGMEIRRGSPYKDTLIAELCNQEEQGYILTPHAYDEGGYEPTATTLRPEAGTMLVRESIQLLKEVHKGQL